MDCKHNYWHRMNYLHRTSTHPISTTYVALQNCPHPRRTISTTTLMARVTLGTEVYPYQLPVYLWPSTRTYTAVAASGARHNRRVRGEKLEEATCVIVPKGHTYPAGVARCFETCTGWVLVLNGNYAEHRSLASANLT